MTTPPQQVMRGIALMLAAFVCFTAIDTCAKWLALSGMPSGQIAFVRFLGHLAMVSALFLPRMGWRLFRTEAPALQLARGAFLLAGTLLNFFAVRHLPLTVTSAIFFTMPLMVCALSIPLLGEKVGARRWAAIAVGFCGVLLVTRPWGAAFHWAVLLSLGATLSASLYALATRRLAGAESAATQQAFAALVGALGAAPLAATGWAWPVDGAAWAAFLLIGAFGFAGHQFMTVAHMHAPASTLAPFVYTQLLTMTASSWLVFGQPPDLWTAAGGAVVAASGLYVWLRERQIASGKPEDQVLRTGLPPSAS